MSSLFYLFLFLLVAVGAFFFGRWHGLSQRSKALSEELKAKEDELSALKESVNKHFDETARLFSNVTEEYKALYQHLATGATKLADRRFDLKLSASSGVPGLGTSPNVPDDSIIDSQATEISDYGDGPQQPKDYVDEELVEPLDKQASSEQTASEPDESTEAKSEAGNSDEHSDSEQPVHQTGDSLKS